MADWSMTISKAENGYIVLSNDDEKTARIFQEDDEDSLKAIEQVLWDVIEYFGEYGSKHDKERIRITREKGMDYEGE